ncbi:MAG: nucleoside-diphosphate sugar epimerase/dehydratase [Acidobacteriota bacterium]
MVTSPQAEVGDSEGRTTDFAVVEGPRSAAAFFLKRRTQFIMDLVALILAFALAYLLRFEFQLAGQESRALSQLPLAVLLQISACYLAGIHTFVWRYVGLREVEAFVRAAAISAVPMVLLRVFLPESAEVWRIPLSIIVMDTLFAFGGLLSLRVLRRIVYERYERGADGPQQRKAVLLVGAGKAGVLAMREIQNRGDMDIRAVGFLDDDPLKQGMVIQGTKVLGNTNDLPRLAKELDIDHVILTIAEADSQRIQRIVETCKRHRIKVRTIPGLYEVLQGKVSISRFRDVELEDLLGREPVRLDEEQLDRFLTGKTVMVTGAGGSIGGELVRQIARFRPSRLVLVERAEPALFEIEQDILALWPDLDVATRMGDVGDSERMRQILEADRPRVVFHAAAHKHVPMMEANEGEAIKNNVLATHRLAGLCSDFQVEVMVLISSDKAVRPSSIMGATKRTAELVVQHHDARSQGTRFLAVRFGNVLGSAGSVIEIFRRQLEAGGPITVTDPRMERFFMTIPEAAQLVLQAAAMGAGGEIFILDMGEPVKIVDLATKMIRLSGFEPGRDIEIVFSGLRPGEKLYEELELDGEEITKTRHPKIFIGQLSPYPTKRIDQALADLTHLSQSGDGDAIRQYLAELLPEAHIRLAQKDLAAS